MKIYFARHGQTDWNILRKVQGTTDIPLNETGMLQANELCQYLQDNHISFAKIYTSYQIRARQTAQIIDWHFHTGFEVVNGLEEMNLGLFEALDNILEQYDTSSDQNLLIISHGAVIMTLIAMNNNIPFEQSHTIAVENARPIEFTIEELYEIKRRLN
ncbi:phosphoglycerate mutase family protein [Butyrivibrio proteoclasticus]|nr:phosphoglycerate mutase family protein [Butyrivibrio proteoclasticus]